MILDGQVIHRIILLGILFNIPCDAWHQSLAFVQRSSYEFRERSSLDSLVLSQMKFFLWYRTYAIYGARETLVILRPNPKNASVNIRTYHWPIDASTMDECLQEWNNKDKCYNDIVHVRIRSEENLMDVYCTYAHRPMVRSFDLERMMFKDENSLIRDRHPPIDSESSYVMLNFHRNIITAGYQGDFIPTIRATHGKTLLYALRPNSYFVDGFSYDNKAVFGVIETSERFETNRISRLVMACANRPEIIRKATLNCSTNLFDSSRSFVFHLLTSLVDPIRTSNGSIYLFTTFTTTNSSLTASAVCLFILNEQFYDVFASRSKSRYTADLHDLIVNCSSSVVSSIDRDMVETEREFLPFNSSPLIIETMSIDRFTSINVIEYEPDLYCLLIGTSHGRLISAFTDSTMKPVAFEELTLPLNLRSSIRSITHQKINSTSYVLIVTHQFGFVILQFGRCFDRYCLHCWSNDCHIRQLLSIEHSCGSDEGLRTLNINDTFKDVQNQSIDSPWTTLRTSDEQSNNRLLFYIVIPMSIIVFLLSMSIIILLTKSNRQEKSRNSSSTSVSSHSRSSTMNFLPIKTDLSIRPISYPVKTLPSIPLLSVTPPQPLSVRRLYKSYV